MAAIRWDRRGLTVANVIPVHICLPMPGPTPKGRGKRLPTEADGSLPREGKFRVRFSLGRDLDRMTKWLATSFQGKVSYPSRPEDGVRRESHRFVSVPSNGYGL